MTNNRWLTVDSHSKFANTDIETPKIVNKKIPNTSSPKELNSPNFSINTDFSRISDLSFFPPRFSTERKMFPKINNDTHDLIDDYHMKLSSDTFTKDSPNTPFEYHMNQIESRQCFPLKEQNQRMCRQALFREQEIRDYNERNFVTRAEHNSWQNDLRMDIRSPPRSLTPPLQSIPEESVQISDTHTFDGTNHHMDTFSVNRTYNKHEKTVNRQTSWSKKAVVKSKILPSTRVSSTKINSTFDANISNATNVTLNYIPNVYSQSLTVDPFLSTTYFYDEALIHKFERDFKRWLNYILTPPDLDSNVEQKIDVGKAWIENRNKEVPTAPTREKVCNAYHNSHRLESLRKSARTLLKTPEISQVLLKLNAQIDKKLIAIRDDRNLHLDIGLQKTIMEIILSYNPLWLRIGLEAIYGVTLPLKSNSDIEGLTLFIIQRMFKNPFLKNKHSKSTAPNMLLPAYIEAIKKFSLKKFFMLVFFLDQAKQKKLISHDPCLFCRNAICKESRQIIIRFTRELIAGIGDITKHLRPLGYVVVHKQTYLDEYKYGVNDIAIDLRDGVRLTKVSEIILMRDNLLCQLRAPAVSRLQKIHNVEVALKALRGANFKIEGEITCTDIADGHREKTLSLLWQLIHVFRAPLFERAANVIQTWWKKKYEVIAEKRRVEQEILRKRNIAAEIIQYWWRRIQYKRMYAKRLYEITCAVITLQKFCRMWLCRSRLRKYKQSVLKIEKWYTDLKLIREAKEILRLKREERRHRCAVLIQSYVRRWSCRKNYLETLNKVVYIQALVRRFLAKKRYQTLRNCTLYIQRTYKRKLLMKKDMTHFAEIKEKVVLIQNYYRMIKQRRLFLSTKNAVKTIEERYLALMKMKEERRKFTELKEVTIKLQASYRRNKCRNEYIKKRNLIIAIQRRIKAYLTMKQTRLQYLKLRDSTVVIQTYLRSYLKMKKIRDDYVRQRKAALIIQNYYRSFIKTKIQRKQYLELKKATITIQTQYRSLLLMKQMRNDFIKMRDAAIIIQRRFRAQVLMKELRGKYEALKHAVLTIQARYRAQKEMIMHRTRFETLKRSCIVIQRFFRAYQIGKSMREKYLHQKEAAIKIQKWYRNNTKGKQIKKQYEITKKACVTIQKVYRSYILTKRQREEYLRIRTATICLQKYYRNYVVSKNIRLKYLQMKTATVTIQRYFRAYLEMRKQTTTYLQIRHAIVTIQTHYRCYREMKLIRNYFVELKSAAVCIQRQFRSLLAMREARQQYLLLRQSTIVIQTRYKALREMRMVREQYLRKKAAIVLLQRKFRAQCLMRRATKDFVTTKTACITIQRFYRAYKQGSQQRKHYLVLRNAANVIQRRYRDLILMRKERTTFLTIKAAVMVIQNRYKAHKLMVKERNIYQNQRKACIQIQMAYRAYVEGRKEKLKYIQIRSAVILIQNWYRSIIETRKLRKQYLQLRTATIFIQRHVRERRLARKNALVRVQAIKTITNWYITIKERRWFLELRRKVVILQSVFRMLVVRNHYLKIRNSAVKIQRYYRSYLLTKHLRTQFLEVKTNITNLQAHVRCFIERRKYQRLKSAAIAIQCAYRLKRTRDLILQNKRERAALCIQKNVRRYLVQRTYKRFHEKLVFIQRLWRGKLLTRDLHFEYIHKRKTIIKLQAQIRGYLVRKEVKIKRENLLKLREQKRQDWAAAKIQALFRGHKVRVANDARILEWRRRWRDDKVHSTQRSLGERNEEAMDVLRNMSDIETVIRAFRSLELLTEVFPMMYNSNAASIVRRVYVYMSVTNRSISSIEVLKSAASVLVNLTRYKITGPKIYARDRIPPVLKFMWRFSNSETHLFCILATYLWLFAKYDDIKKDLKDYLHEPENHKIMVAIKGNVDRMKRMVTNSARHRLSTPQSSRFVSHMNQSRDIANVSVCSNSSSSSNPDLLLPALDPDYGISRADKPRYFEDAQQAISCLFHAYEL
ncbi:unnamed protein product [Colias eurytheme]|nr:unnamed protein product [Colias eurytheme]